MSKQPKSGRYVRFAQLAYRAVQASYPKYRRKKSKKMFTQPQLIACVLLELYLNVSYCDCEGGGARSGCWWVEAKWGTALAGRNVLVNLVTQSQLMPEVAQGWQVDYVLFSRSGFTYITNQVKALG